MANTFEYIVSLQDRVSAVVEKVSSRIGDLTKKTEAVSAKAKSMATSASSSFSTLVDKAKSAIRGPEFISASIDELKEKLASVNEVRFGSVMASEVREATKEAQRLEFQIKRLEQGITGGSIGAKIAGWRKDLFEATPIAKYLKNPIVAFTGLVTTAIASTKKAMTDQIEEMKFITATGSEEIGRELFGGIARFGAQSGFGDELNGIAMKMIGQGIDSSSILPLLQQMGDISQGSSEKMNKLSEAFVAVSNRGLLSERRLRDLRSMGFDPLQTLADHTGESIENLEIRMANGQIGVEDFTKAVQYATGEGGQFHGVIDDIANTPEGQLRQLRQNIDQMMIKIGNVFLPIAHKFMTFLNFLSEKAGPFIKPLTIAFAGLATVLLLVSAAHWALTSSIAASTIAVLKNTAAWLMSPVGVLAGIIGLIVIKWNEFGAATNMVLGIVSFFFKRTFFWFGIFISIVMTVKEHWSSIVDAFKFDGIIGGLKRISVVLLDVVLKPIQQLLEMLSKIPGMGKLAGSGADKIKALRESWGLASEEGSSQKTIEQTGQKVSETTDKTTAKLLLDTENQIRKRIQDLQDSLGNMTIGSDDYKATKHEISRLEKKLNPDRKGSSINKTNDATATGGTRNTVINITMKSMVELIQIMKGNGFKESAQDMEEEISDALLRTLAMATTTAG